MTQHSKVAMTKTTPTSAAVSIRGLSKHYGDKPALDGLKLEIGKGEIFGYIGPNGAGKTTTLRILAGLLKPTSGAAHILDVDVERSPRRVKELVGYMPDEFGVYENMTLYEYLDFFGAAFRIPRAKRRAIIEDVLALTDLAPKRDDEVSAFSRGMTQRACLAKTLLHDPEVLILDEPASGLDPRARIEFRELLKELQNMGKTILVSSHILSELSTICTSVGILESGVLITSGDVKTILEKVRAHRSFVIALLHETDRDRTVALLEQRTEVRNVERIGGAVRVSLDATEPEIAGLIQALSNDEILFTEFREEHADLETAFLTLTEGRLA